MILELFTLIARCDVCGTKSAPYTTEDKSCPPPAPWVTGNRWNRSWSALLTRHYCSQACSDSESHGLKPPEPATESGPKEKPHPDDCGCRACSGSF